MLQVPRPDGKPDNLGFLVLDEPAIKQSDPTVLSLWLSENSKQHNMAVSVAEGRQLHQRGGGALWPRSKSLWVKSGLCSSSR